MLRFLKYQSSRNQEYPVTLRVTLVTLLNIKILFLNVIFDN